MRLLAVLLAVALCVLSAVFLLRDLPPPKQLVFAAGPRDGGYWDVARQYRDHLAGDGISLEIIETAGSLDNLDLLESGQADIGLLQGGVSTHGSGLEALGAVFLEPVLVFGRGDRPIPANPGRWTGLTIARGELGSGTRAATDRLLDGIGIAASNTLTDRGAFDAAAALLAGEVDVAIFVAPLSASYLVPLLQSAETRLLRIDHIEAVALRLPHSRVVSVPSGVVSLDPVVPPRPMPVVALTARLAAVPDLHPAIVDRLLVAARQIHGAQGLFARQGQFPSVEGVDMPIDPGALKLLVEGQGVFHDWLPYWIAAQIRRVLLVLLPLLFLVVPLVRSLPMVYRWSMKRRVWRHYGEVRRIEEDLEDAETAEKLADIDRRLNEIDHELATMRLPPAFRDLAYNARLHVELVRRHIAVRREAMGRDGMAANEIR